MFDHRRRRGGQVAGDRRGLCRGSPHGASPATTSSSRVGGGVVTDTAGFAAAVYHRGRPRRARRDHAARPRSTPPSAARPASTCPRARTSSARSGSRAASLCDTEVARRRCRRGSTCGLRRDGEVPLPRRRRPARPAPRRARRPLRGDQGRLRRRPTSARADVGRCSTTATPSPTPSRPPAGYDLAPRRGGRRSGSSTPPTWRGARPDRRRRCAAPLRRGRQGVRARHSRSRRASTPEVLVELMGRDKKALDCADVRARRAGRRRGGARRSRRGGPDRARPAARPVPMTALRDARCCAPSGCCCAPGPMRTSRPTPRSTPTRR